MKKDSTSLAVSAPKGLGKANVQIDTPYSLQSHLLLTESFEQVPVESSGSGSTKNHRKKPFFWTKLTAHKASNQIPKGRGQAGL